MKVSPTRCVCVLGLPAGVSLRMSPETCDAAFATGLFLRGPIRKLAGKSLTLWNDKMTDWRGSLMTSLEACETPPPPCGRLGGSRGSGRRATGMAGQRELLKGQDRLFAARCRGGRTSWNVSRMAVRERPVRRPVLFFEDAVTKSTEETSRKLEASRIMPTKPF